MTIRAMSFAALLAVISLMTVSSCGRIPKDWWKVTDNEDAEKAEKKKTGGPLVVGYWTGVFQERGLDGKLLEPVPVVIEINRGSSFQIVFPEKEGVYVRGDYREFSTRQSLLLTIRESTFSLVGSPGRMVDMRYRVEAEEMTLTGDSGEYTVGRATKPGGPGEDGATVDGAWHCRDRRGNRWSLGVDLDGGRFSASIVNGGKPLRIAGSVQPDGAAYRMRVQQSNKADVVGAVFSVELGASGTLWVRPEQGADESFECRR